MPPLKVPIVSIFCHFEHFATFEQWYLYPRDPSKGGYRNLFIGPIGHNIYGRKIGETSRSDLKIVSKSNKYHKICMMFSNF